MTKTKQISQEEDDPKVILFFLLTSSTSNIHKKRTKSDKSRVENFFLENFLQKKKYYINLYAFWRILLTFPYRYDIINYVEVLAESELTQCTKTKEFL